MTLHCIDHCILWIVDSQRLHCNIFRTSLDITVGVLLAGAAGSPHHNLYMHSLEHIYVYIYIYIGVPFVFGCFFRGRFWIFVWVPGSMLSCFSNFLLLCFSASLLFCFCASLLFASLLLFPASLLFLLLCFLLFAFPASLLFCFSGFHASLLLCFLFLLSLCFSCSFALFCSVCILNETLERP